MTDTPSTLIGALQASQTSSKTMLWAASTACNAEMGLCTCLTAVQSQARVKNFNSQQLREAGMHSHHQIMQTDRQ